MIENSIHIVSICKNLSNFQFADPFCKTLHRIRLKSHKTPSGPDPHSPLRKPSRVVCIKEMCGPWSRTRIWATYVVNVDGFT